MFTHSRRNLLKSAGAAATTLATARLASAAGANERITVGVIGCGGMGSDHLRALAGMKEVAVAWACDVDRNRAGEAAKAAEQAAGRAPRTAADLRQVLDDKSVDAVFIATPDHWHVPAGILACAAGKHAYIEKPCSHNIREGRLLVEAAKRSGRVVQIGTQSRSAPYLIEAMKRLREGVIGEVLAAKAWNSQLRSSIGRASPSEPPAHLDFDLWLGPAPVRPYQQNLLHGIWRWWFDFGTGDIGNDGIHEIDIARWGLGVTTHPSTISGMAGKYFFDDDQQFADTYQVMYEYPGDGRPGSRRQLVYEQRTWSPYFQEGYENGNAFYGTKGMMLLGKQSGWRVIGPRNEPGPKMDGSLSIGPHHQNFFAGIRSGSPPNAGAEIGHLSAGLSHLGNIVARTGRTLHFDPTKEVITGDEEANRLVSRSYRPGHWAVPGPA